MLRALVVGLNDYPGAPLRGCVNDANGMATYVESRGGTVVRLLNEAGTTEAIRKGLRELCGVAMPGDALLFHYSGHGAQVRDRGGDEVDSLDETLCPIDFDWEPEHMITDDDMAELTQHVPIGATLTLVLDSCHSGTMLRGMNLVGNPAMLRYRAYPMNSPDHVRSITGVSQHGWRSVLRWPPRLRTMGTRAAHGATLLLSATLPGQLAADAFIDGRSQGAHTATLLMTLAKQPGLPMRRTRNEINAWLQEHNYGGPTGQTAKLYGNQAMRRLPFLLSK